MSLTENNTVQQYKCPNCGASISFGADTQNMKCEYCDCEFDIQTLKEFNAIAEEEQKDLQWAHYDEGHGNNEWAQGEKEEVKKYACQSCGGTLITDSVTVASKCPYCDSPIIVPSEMTGEYRPDLVLPFQVTREGAIEGFSKFLKDKKLLPNTFVDQNHIEEVTGIYVPFWLFDSKANGHITYKATRSRMWTMGEYRYTRTDFYMVKRGGVVDFANIPADGSSKMDDTMMESIEPFDFTKGVDFNTAYLSGYLAQNYDVTSENLVGRISERMGKSFEQLCSNTVHGYNTKTITNRNLNNTSDEIRYALLPVWILNTKYNGELYTFAMNGQTGKFVGNLPIDNMKAVKYFFMSFGISLAACGTVMAIIANFM